MISLRNKIFAFVFIFSSLIARSENTKNIVFLFKPVDIKKTPEQLTVKELVKNHEVSVFVVLKIRETIWKEINVIPVVEEALYLKVKITIPQNITQIVHYIRIKGYKERPIIQETDFSSQDIPFKRERITLTAL